MEFLRGDHVDGLIASLVELSFPIPGVVIDTIWMVEGVLFLDNQHITVWRCDHRFELFCNTIDNQHVVGSLDFLYRRRRRVVRKLAILTDIKQLLHWRTIVDRESRFGLTIWWNHVFSFIHQLKLPTGCPALSLSQAHDIAENAPDREPDDANGCW